MRRLFAFLNVRAFTYMHVSQRIALIQPYLDSFSEEAAAFQQVWQKFWKNLPPSLINAPSVESLTNTPDSNCQWLLLCLLPLSRYTPC